MESDDQIKETDKKIKDLQGIISDAGDVLPSFGIRCTVQATYGADRIVLDSRRYLLWNFRLFLCFLYITFEIFKQF